MRVAIAKRGEFVPEWNGNRDLPEEEQVRVDYKFLSYEERSMHLKTKPIRMQMKDVDNLDGALAEIEYIQDKKGIALKSDVHVHNLETEDKDTGEIKVCKTMRDLYDSAAFPELAIEIENHLLNANARVDSKNSG